MAKMITKFFFFWTVYPLANSVPADARQMETFQNGAQCRKGKPYEARLTQLEVRLERPALIDRLANEFFFLD